jgi:hypothetical protein
VGFKDSDLGLVVSCFDGGGFICVNLRAFYLRESAVDVLLGVTCGSGFVWDLGIQKSVGSWQRAVGKVRFKDS